MVGSPREPRPSLAVAPIDQDFPNQSLCPTVALNPQFAARLYGDDGIRLRAPGAGTCEAADLWLVWIPPTGIYFNHMRAVGSAHVVNWLGTHQKVADQPTVIRYATVR